MWQIFFSTYEVIREKGYPLTFFLRSQSFDNAKFYNDRMDFNRHVASFMKLEGGEGGGPDSSKKS